MVVRQSRLRLGPGIREARDPGGGAGWPGFWGGGAGRLHSSAAAGPCPPRPPHPSKSCPGHHMGYVQGAGSTLGWTSPAHSLLPSSLPNQPLQLSTGIRAQPEVPQPPRGGRWEQGTWLSGPHTGGTAAPPLLSRGPRLKPQDFGVQQKALEAPTGGGGPQKAQWHSDGTMVGAREHSCLAEGERRGKGIQGPLLPGRQ